MEWVSELVLPFAFKEKPMRRTVVFDCSAESRNGMTSDKNAEYLECHVSGRMCRNVEHIYGIWHESRCITIHKLVNELGTFWCVIKFWHQTEFATDCVKISALCADWWTETIRIVSMPTRTLKKCLTFTLPFRSHYRWHVYVDAEISIGL
jgi:hypothetical protein